MNETSTGAALERLERALARVQRAVEVRDAAFARLDSRHATLRARVEATIGELDRVIAEAAKPVDPA